MSEATLKPTLTDGLGQRVRDTLPPWIVCGLIALIGLLIPALLLKYQMPLVIGSVVALLGLAIVTTWPYVGLLVFLALLYLRPEETFPALAGARMTLNVSLVTLFAWVINAFLHRERFLFHSPVVRCLAGFAAVAILSTAIGVSDLGTVGDEALDVIKLLILFLLVIHLVNTPSRLRVAAGAVLLLTAFLGARTIWQYYNGEALVQSDGDVRALASGIFGDPNDLALAMAMALPLSLGLLFGKVKWPTRLWCLASAVVLVWTIFITNSRGGVLALGASVFLLFGRRLGRIGVVVGALAVLLLFAFGPSRMSQMSSDEESAQGRVTAWDAGMDMLRSSPVWGVGKDQFVEHHWLTAHNSLVLCLGELGLLGTAFWIGLFYFTIRDGRRARVPPGPVGDECQLEELSQTPPPAPARALRKTQTYPELLQISLVTFMVGGFFLSRTYTAPLYVYLGLAAAAARVEADRSGLVLPGAESRDWVRIAAITLGGVVLIMFLVKLWS